MPAECAPLVFLGLDAAVEMPGSPDVVERTTSAPAAEPTGSTSAVAKKGKASRSFVQDYFDRRAQATYAHYQPGSTLTKMSSAPQFRSRYANPNHPAGSGHLFSLLTGGKVNPPPRGARRRYELANKKQYEEWEKDKVRLAKGEKMKGKYGGATKRKLREDVLYLIVVNLPSESEMSEARASAARREGR